LNVKKSQPGLKIQKNSDPTQTIDNTSDIKKSQPGSEIQNEHTRACAQSQSNPRFNSDM
jgi:hypothetical protein